MTAIDSDTTISLSADIFDTGNENYKIYTNLRPADITFANEGSDNFLLDSTDTGAQELGKDLSADANLAFTDDILGFTRS